MYRHASVALIVLAVGCQTGAPPTAAPSPTLTSTALPSPTSAPSPSPTAVANTPSPAPSGPLPLVFGKLDAGTYTSTNFGVSLTFVLEGGTTGWSGYLDEHLTIELFAQRNASDILLLALPTGYGQEDKGLFDSLEGQMIDVGTIREVTVDGYPAKEADFFVHGVSQEPSVFSAGGDTWFATLGSHQLLIQIDLGDRDLIIVVETPEGEWVTMEPIARAVIDSIRFD